MEGFCELRINCSAETPGSSRKIKLDRFPEAKYFCRTLYFPGANHCENTYLNNENTYLIVDFSPDNLVFSDLRTARSCCLCCLLCPFCFSTRL